MEFLLALVLAAMPQGDEETTKMPEGWVTGKRAGWDGDYPPGWKQKKDEEKEKFLEQWNAAKFKYIQHMQGVRGTPTGAVTGINFMLKAVNGGVRPGATAELALFGQGRKLKEADFAAMMRALCAVHGTDVPHGEAVNIVKDLVITGLRGPMLAKRIRDEILKKDRDIKEAKARKEKEMEKEKEKEKKESEDKK